MDPSLIVAHVLWDASCACWAEGGRSLHELAFLDDRSRVLDAHTFRVPVANRIENVFHSWETEVSSPNVLRRERHGR